jgi:opacity protein-like surface antigen
MIAEVQIMKSLINAIAVALVLAAPAVSFAQVNQPVTRAEVRAQLAQLEKAGYDPARANSSDYPQNIQAAEARIAEQNGSATYGGVVSGSSTSGVHAYKAEADSTGPRSVFFGQ